MFDYLRVHNLFTIAPFWTNGVRVEAVAGRAAFRSFSNALRFVVMRVSGSRLWAVICVAAASLGLAGVDANARPSICVKLERQLASAGGQGAGGSARFQNAARAQAQQLQIARSQAKRAGCTGSFLFFGGANSDSRSCQRVSTTIRRMENNLAKLQSRSGGGDSGLSKARIRAALDANDCYDRVIAVSAKRTLPAAIAPERRGVLNEIFGGEVIERRPRDKTASANVRDLSSSSRDRSSSRSVKVINGNGDREENIGPGGTYRTLCVRTCDGYYFPVSFSTTSSHFQDDVKSCSAMCPGAETKLYYHSIPDQEPEEMISLAKEPYTTLPTAFKYRVNGASATAGCTCQAQQEASVEVPAIDAPGAKKVRWIPVPAFKPHLLEDAETVLNREGSLDAAAIANLIEAKSPSAGLTPGRRIRVVGPVFLPAQSRAEELPVPGRVTVQ
jgi:hypothetical protein